MSKTKNGNGAKRKFQGNNEAYAQFVAIWNAAENKDEVIEKSGISEKKVAAWSYRLRKAGVPLQYFRNRENIDVKALTEIAKKAARG